MTIQKLRIGKIFRPSRPGGKVGFSERMANLESQLEKLGKALVTEHRPFKYRGFSGTETSDDLRGRFFIPGTSILVQYGRLRGDSDRVTFDEPFDECGTVVITPRYTASGPAGPLVVNTTTLSEAYFDVIRWAKGIVHANGVADGYAFDCLWVAIGTRGEWQK